MRAARPNLARRGENLLWRITVRKELESLARRLSSKTEQQLPAASAIPAVFFPRSPGFAGPLRPARVLREC
jgi:hypothetical protein